MGAVKGSPSKMALCQHPLTLTLHRWRHQQQHQAMILLTLAPLPLPRSHLWYNINISISRYPTIPIPDYAKPVTNHNVLAFSRCCNPYSYSYTVL
jgi:hypothetical protein